MWEYSIISIVLSNILEHANKITLLKLNKQWWLTWGNTKKKYKKDVIAGIPRNIFGNLTSLDG